MLAFIIYFLIGFGIGLIVRKNIEVVSSKRKYVTLMIVAIVTLAIFTGNVSPQAAGAAAAFTFFGCLSALTAKFDLINKLKSKYVHYWLIPVMLVAIYFLSFANSSDQPTDFSGSDNELLEEMAENSYQYRICSEKNKNCNSYEARLGDLWLQADMRDIDFKRQKAAMDLGEYRATQVIKEKE